MIYEEIENDVEGELIFSFRKSRSIKIQNTQKKNTKDFKILCFPTRGNVEMIKEHLKDL